MDLARDYQVVKDSELLRNLIHLGSHLLRSSVYHYGIQYDGKILGSIKIVGSIKILGSIRILGYIKILGSIKIL